MIIIFIADLRVISRRIILVVVARFYDLNRTNSNENENKLRDSYKVIVVARFEICTGSRKTSLETDEKTLRSRLPTSGEEKESSNFGNSGTETNRIEYDSTDHQSSPIQMGATFIYARSYCVKYTVPIGYMHDNPSKTTVDDILVRIAFRKNSTKVRRSMTRPLNCRTLACLRRKLAVDEKTCGAIRSYGVSEKMV